MDAEGKDGISGEPQLVLLSRIATAALLLWQFARVQTHVDNNELGIKPNSIHMPH